MPSISLIHSISTGNGATCTVGATFDPKGAPTLRVWAPTAQSVSLLLDGKRVAMRRDDRTGNWCVTGEKSWLGKKYLYEVKVWAPTVQKIVTNQVTDPYSVALTTDSKLSIIADLDAKSLAPSGWSTLKKPAAVPLKEPEPSEAN